jgi:hypothetical protein
MSKILYDIPLLIQLICLGLVLLMLCWKLVMYLRYKHRYQLENFSNVLYFSKYQLINSRSINSRKFKLLQNRLTVFLVVVLALGIIIFLLFNPEIFD